MRSITQEEDREYRSMENERAEFKYNELEYELRDEEPVRPLHRSYCSRWKEDRAAYSTPGSDW